MIPDYDTVVIDEAHELVQRVTQAATDELGASDIERAARRASRWTDGDGDPAGDLEDAAAQLASRSLAPKAAAHSKLVRAFPGIATTNWVCLTLLSIFTFPAPPKPKP